MTNLTKQQYAKVVKLLRLEHKIEAIKEVRDWTGLRLREAKDLVEDIGAKENVTSTPVVETVMSPEEDAAWTERFAHEWAMDFIESFGPLKAERYARAVLEHLMSHTNMRAN